MKVRTTRFGELEVPKEKIIHFPRGILGFDRITRYFLMDYEDTPIKWLQSVEDPEVAFMVVDPLMFFPDYGPELSAVEKELLGLKKPEDFALLAVMKVSRDKEPRVTLNLMAPLVLNASTMCGFQIVMEKSRYRVNEPVAA